MRGRLAPTPSGHLHLGNALAFGIAWLSARAQRGELLLRIEDIDAGRARADIAAALREDLRWLGIDWDRETAPQSQRGYALDGIPIYRCDCSRKMRLAGECCCRGAAKSQGVYRFATPGGAVPFVDRARGELALAPGDDPILQSVDGAALYTLAVVLDDLRDGVTEVVRGADLLEATPAQIRLFEALGRTPPVYLHTPVLLGADGKKLSKSHGSTEIRALRAAGLSAAEIWRRLLPLAGLPPVGLGEAVAHFEPTAVPAGPFVVEE